MVASTAHFASPHNGDAHLAVSESSPLAIRGTIRGKTHLSLADLEAKVVHYPEPVREKTRAVQAYFVERCDSNFEQLRGLALQLKIEKSPEYFSNWVKGFMFRGGTSNVGDKGRSDWLEFCDKLIEHARLTSPTGKGTIMTGTCRAIIAHAMKVMDQDNPMRMCGIAGPTGAQKTASLSHLMVQLGGWPKAVLLDCTVGMGITQFKRTLGNLYNCRVGNKAGVLDEAIAKQLKGTNRVLVVENVQRACHEKEGQVDVVNYLIRLQEDCGFPLVTSFTRDFLQRMTSGRNKGQFEQFVGRMGGSDNVLVLPDFTPKADLREIAEAYNLHDGEAAMELLVGWSREFGRIRNVFSKLYLARQFAKADGKDRITLELLKEAAKHRPAKSINEKGESQEDES